METREIILTLIEASQQLKVLHWQTTSYAEHEALGGLYADLEDAADAFAEALIAIDGKRPSLKDSIMLEDYANLKAGNYINAIIKQLEAIKDAPSDILNMRDDLTAKCRKTIYLLTLNGEEAEEEDEEEEKDEKATEPPLLSE